MDIQPETGLPSGLLLVESLTIGLELGSLPLTANAVRKMDDQKGARSRSLFVRVNLFLIRIASRSRSCLYLLRCPRSLARIRLFHIVRDEREYRRRPVISSY